MKEHHLKRLLHSAEILDNRIGEHLTKGYFSKNHDATLCALIKHYHRKLLTAEDLALFNSLYLDEHDILFYAQSWQEREKASYSSEKAFSTKTVRDILLKTHLSVSKCEEMLKQQ